MDDIGFEWNDGVLPKKCFTLQNNTEISTDYGAHTFK